jgi:hypothetical protein
MRIWYVCGEEWWLCVLPKKKTIRGFLIQRVRTAYVVRPHDPDGASTVGAARIGRGAGGPRGDLRPPEPIVPRAFYSVFGCFGRFLALGKAAGGVFSGAGGAKYVFPHPCGPIELDVAMSGPGTGFGCISLRNRRAARLMRVRNVIHTVTEYVHYS